MASYKQFFYRVDVGIESGDIGAAKRAQLAKATINLQLAEDILMATCCGGRGGTSGAPEIALVVINSLSASTFVPHVQNALAYQGLDAQVLLEDDVRDYKFTEEQLEDIGKTVQVEDLDATYRAINEMCAYVIPTSPQNGQNGSDVPKDSSSVASVDGNCDVAPEHNDQRSGTLTYVKDFPASHQGEAGTLGEFRLLRMRSAKDSAIASELEGLHTTYQLLVKETKSNVATALLIAEGMMTVGKVMWTAFVNVPYGGSLTVFIGDVIAAMGGMAQLSISASILGAVVAVLFLLTKDETNGLLFANGTRSAIDVTSDYIIHGERFSVLTSLEGYYDYPKKPRAYHYGSYVYKKKFMSMYGSTLGIAFRQGNGYFSLGLDCPNVQRNSVSAVFHQNPQVAAEKADNTDDSEATLKFSATSKLIIRRADKYGNVNHCICTLVAS